MGKIIGVVSLKGGVGKTTTVASLGAALSERGKKVLVVDGNLSSPNLGLHLNIIDPERTLHHVLNRSANLSDAIYEYEGFDVLPASLYEKIKVNPLNLKNRLRSLKRKYDVIFLDSSPALNAETLGVILASDEVFVVTTPDHATLSTTIKAVRLAKNRGTPISGIIINKFYGKRFEVPLESVENSLDMPVLAVIPYDKNIIKALSHMEPFVFHKPNAKGSVEMKKLAAAMSGEKYKQTMLKDFIRKVKPKKQEINRDIFYESVFSRK